MAVKAIVQTLDGIPDHLKTEYKPIEGGTGFFLDAEDIEAHPRVGALKRAKEREATEATSAKAALKAATEAFEALKAEHEKLAGEFDERLRTAVGSKSEDLAKLDEKWGSKLKKAVDEASTKISQRDAALNKLLVEGKAREIVSKMNPADPDYVDVILPHVIRRLGVELVGEEGRTVVLDADGKRSADTIEELTEHFRVDKRFAPLLTGSKATGGSANGGNGKNPGSAGSINLATATEAEKVAYYKARAGVK